MQEQREQKLQEQQMHLQEIFQTSLDPQYYILYIFYFYATQNKIIYDFVETCTYPVMRFFEESIITVDNTIIKVMKIIKVKLFKLVLLYLCYLLLWH